MSVCCSNIQRLVCCVASRDGSDLSVSQGNAHVSDKHSSSPRAQPPRRASGGLPVYGSGWKTLTKAYSVSLTFTCASDVQQ